MPGHSGCWKIITMYFIKIKKEKGGKKITTRVCEWQWQPPAWFSGWCSVQQWDGRSGLCPEMQHISYPLLFRKGRNLLFWMDLDLRMLLMAIFSLYSVPEAFFFGFHLLAIRLNICCARRWEETNTDKSTRFLEKKIIHAQTHREPGLQHNSLIRKNIICRIEYAFCHFHQVTVYLLNLHLDFSYSYWFLHPILPWGYSHFWNPSQLGIRPDWY